MEQLKLDFAYEEYRELRFVVRKSYAAVKKRFPTPVKGETMEEYHDFIIGETLLEVAQRITEIALRRQKKNINSLYHGAKYGNF